MSKFIGGIVIAVIPVILGVIGTACGTGRRLAKLHDAGGGAQSLSRTITFIGTAGNAVGTMTGSATAKRRRRMQARPPSRPSQWKSPRRTSRPLKSRSNRLPSGQARRSSFRRSVSSAANSVADYPGPRSTRRRTICRRQRNKPKRRRPRRKRMSQSARRALSPAAPNICCHVVAGRRWRPTEHARMTFYALWSADPGPPSGWRSAFGCSFTAADGRRAGAQRFGSAAAISR